MKEGIKRPLILIVLITLIIVTLTALGFLTFKVIKPAEVTKTEEKKEETQKEEAPEGRGTGNASTGVTLMSVADTVINNYQPNTNYGNTSGMDISHNDNPHIESRGLMLFNLNSIPTNSVIDSATLKLRVSICGGPGPTMLTAAQAINPWGEITATWNNKPSFSGGVSKSSLCTVPSEHALDVKEIVKKWVNNSEKNYGFVIYGGDSGSWDFGFGTRENNSVQLRPQLDITYHEPTVTPPTDNQGQDNTNTSGSNNIGSNIGDPEVPGSDSNQEVAPPLFTHIIKNGEKIEAPISDIVEIKEGDSLEAFGTAIKGRKVVIFIRGFANDPVIDEKGNWSFKFDPLKIEEEEATVQVQVYTENGKSSSVVDMFQIKRVADAKTTETEAKKSTFWQNLLDKYIWYLFGGLIIFLIVLGTVLFFLIKKGKEAERISRI